MVDQTLGQATIVYEDPDEGTVERTVDGEHLAYAQDHWILRTGTDDQGRDTVRRIPRQRVYYVERTVEAFEDEVPTIGDQVHSIADDLRTKLVGGGGSRDESDVRRINVESGEPDETGDRS